MESYSRAAVERAMKVQEVILRAIAKKITWWQAAEIIGISDRSMRRWRERYEQFGFDGLLDRRRCRPSEKRVPLAVVEQVLGLYRDRYFDCNVRHFHEKLVEEPCYEHLFAGAFAEGMSSLQLEPSKAARICFCV